MHKCEIFSDIFAQKKSPVTGIDARIKLVFALLALLVSLLSLKTYVPLAIAALCLIALISIRIPVVLLILRLAVPLFMAGVVLMTQLFLNGVTPLFTVDLGIFRLTGYEEGLAQGLLIMSRVIGGMLVLLLLTMSTPAHELFLAARWLKMPKSFVELALLVYRYIFVLADEVAVIRNAQKVRLGYRGWSRVMGSTIVLGGSLVLRSYDRAERVFEAMLVRGYSGAIGAIYQQRLQRNDYLTAIVLSALMASLFLVGRFT
ncbi:MAG: cobalt ECF transporter T component CbiQ [Chloroflexi bacterium]|nr:cobalt ECF transporter T component CbiQ [Chloroflexota bacterium]